MHHFFVSPEQIGEKEITILGNDVNHIRNVLRMAPGEQVTISNGEDQNEYRCEILSVNKDCVKTQIMWIEENGVELPSKIYLFQGLPKSDKMEIIIQKAVELGVYQIIPVATERAVVKLDKKKEEAKRKRWQGISESAAKQSKRMMIPEIAEIMNFRQAVEFAKEIDVCLIPYELAGHMEKTREIISSLQIGQTIAVFIGPEGGFTPGEIDLAVKYGFSPISLGKRILRTETAGMTMMSILMYHMETAEEKGNRKADL